MVVARKRSRHLVQGQSNRELRLRVVGSQRDGQVIRLTSSKCTIGSARGCTLRLRAAGVRPIHCLILRGAQATVARTCPAGARLNGEEFLDAPLVAGDQLQVGPVTLEVMEQSDGDETGDHDNAAAAAVCDADKAERIRVAHRRARKLVEAVRTARAETELLRQQSADQHAAGAAELDADRQRWTDENHRQTADWRRQSEEGESSLKQDRDELDRHKSELEHLKLELEAQAERLRVDRDSWEQVQQAAARERDLEQQSLAAERQSLAGLQESLQRDRAGFEQEQRDRYNQIEQRGGELARGQQELAELRQQLESQRHQWESQRSELEQAHASGHGEIDQLRTLLNNDRQAWSELQKEQEGTLKEQVAELQTQREELARRQGELQAALSDIEQRSQDLASREEQCHAVETTCQQRQVELDALAAQLAAEQSTLADSAAQHEQHRSELEQAQAGLEQARGELERAHHALDRARAEVEHDRGQLHERQARLAEERTEFEAEQLVLAESRAELARSQAEIAAGFEQLLEGHEALESARRQFAEREQSLAAREESVDDRLNEAHRHRAAWAIELSAWESIQATAQPTETSAHEDHGAALEELEAHLSDARDRFAAQEQQLDESLSQCAALSAELEQLRSEFEQQQAAFADERTRWDEQRQTWASREAEDFGGNAETTLGVSEEAPFDEEATVKMEAPPTVEEMDAFTPESVDDEYGDADLESCENVRDGGASSEPDEDKSIEECFEELLNRYRKQGTESAPPIAPVKRGKRKSETRPTKAPIPAAAPSSPVNLQATMEIPVVDLLTPPTEIQRRSSAETPNFDAMREVAVSHANLAIGAHGRKRLLRAALVTSSAALGAVFVTLIMLGGLAHHYTGLRTLANVGWVLAIFWAFVASKAWRQVAAARKADEQGLRENRDRATRKSSG